MKCIGFHSSPEKHSRCFFPPMMIFLGHKKIWLECPKCIIKGFQLQGNCMLIIIIGSPAVLSIYNIFFRLCIFFNRLVRPELNSQFFPNLKWKQMQREGTFPQIPALFLASLPPGLGQSPSPFMSTTGRAHAAPGPMAAATPRRLSFSFPLHRSSREELPAWGWYAHKASSYFCC